jgi:transposase-like protein
MDKKATKFSPEVRKRAERFVPEQRSEHRSMWVAVESIAPIIGCTPQMLHEWVRRNQIGRGERDDVTTDERERLRPCGARSRSSLWWHAALLDA